MNSDTSHVSVLQTQPKHHLPRMIEHLAPDRGALAALPAHRIRQDARRAGAGVSWFRNSVLDSVDPSRLPEGTLVRPIRNEHRYDLLLQFLARGPQVDGADAEAES